MKYYLHDSNAFNDEKITELFMEYGYEGLGLFYTFLEKIASQEKPIKTSVLKSQLKVGKKLERCWSFMESIGLIQSIDDETFNIRLLNYSEKYKIKSEKNAKRVLKFRDKELVIKNVTHYESVCNASKVKEIKVNKSKDIKEEIPQVEDECPFELFWNLYDKKRGDKTKLLKKWNFISLEERKKIIVHVPLYVESTPEKKFRQDPETYLNNKSWNNEIIYPNQVNNKRNINVSKSHSSESLSDPTIGFNNNFNGVNKTYKNEAEKRNAERTDFKQMCLAIIDQPK